MELDCTKIAFENEKNQKIEDYEKEVYVWKKELGDASKRHDKLQKKFNVLQTEIYSQAFVDCPCNNENSCMSDDLGTCAICAMEMTGYVPEYYHGSIVEPVCETCNLEANLSSDQVFDPFSSFPADGPPVSLVSHWIPPNTDVCKISPSSCFKAHYVLLEKPSCVVMEEAMTVMTNAMLVFERRMDRRCKEVEDGCTLN